MADKRVSNTSKRLREALDLRNMRQSRLSEITGISKPQISEYLKGKCSPKQDKLYTLGEALDVSPVWLMGYDVSVEWKENKEITKDIIDINLDDEKLDQILSKYEIRYGEIVLDKKDLKKIIELIKIIIKKDN